MAGMAGVPTWQGVPQPQLPTGQMPQLQQPASMVGAYPVQQFQVGLDVCRWWEGAWVGRVGWSVVRPSQPPQLITPTHLPSPIYTRYSPLLLFISLMFFLVLDVHVFFLLLPLILIYFALEVQYLLDKIT